MGWLLLTSPISWRVRKFIIWWHLEATIFVWLTVVHLRMTLYKLGASTTTNVIVVLSIFHSLPKTTGKRITLAPRRWVVLLGNPIKGDSTFYKSFFIFLVASRHRERVHLSNFHSRSRFFSRWTHWPQSWWRGPAMYLSVNEIKTFLVICGLSPSDSNIKIFAMYTSRAPLDSLS